MSFFWQNNRKILLGQLLIKENLISKNQLDRAIEQQRKTGQRLGDIIAEWDILSKKQIAKILRKQRNLRLIASIVTAFLGPVPSLATTVDSISTASVQSSSPVFKKQEIINKKKNKQINNIPISKYSSNIDVVDITLDSSFCVDDFEINESKESALRVIELHHSRVANAIRNMWDYKECSEYINKLLVNGNSDKGNARAGFHQEAVDAMFFLVSLHEKKFHSQNSNQINNRIFAW